MKHLIFFSVLFSLSSTAQEPSKAHTSATAPKEVQKNFKESQFKSHMINHFNEGCPSNSECSADMGKLYKRWTDSLENFSTEKDGWRILDKFRRDNGIPFELWTTSNAKAEEGLIFWDSPCEAHNKENKINYGLGVAMVKHLKDLKKLEKDNKVHLRFLKLFQGDKKPIVSYQTLRGENPLYVDGEKLVYQKLEEGYSYGLAVKSTGELNIVKTKTPSEFPRSFECPKKLVDSLDKSKMPENLYGGVYCQKTWNVASKKYDVIMVGWSCN